MKIEFEFTTPHGIFRDALYVEDTTSEQEIEAMKQERLNNWLAIIENPPIEEEQDFIEIDGVRYAKVDE